jgi:hypothetical protein
VKGWRECTVEFGTKWRGLYQQWRNCLEIKVKIICECNFASSFFYVPIEVGFLSEWLLLIILLPSL